MFVPVVEVEGPFVSFIGEHLVFALWTGTEFIVESKWKRTTEENRGEKKGKWQGTSIHAFMPIPTHMHV